MRLDHPRIRGEHRASRHPCDSGTGSSPHTRGALLGSCGLRGRPRDHPRIRGEHAGWVSSVSRVTGSSPHTRGAPPGDDGRPCSRWDHPRIRGEHSNAALYGRSWSGSSPHTRGALRLQDRHPESQRIIPAYAGSTSEVTWLDVRARDHPRIRGEHPACPSPPSRPRGSSPHTRGALPRIRRKRSVCGIIPAYAGSTSYSPPRNSTTRDHPRIRGEHVEAYWYTSPTPGSSPHTRGARRSRGPRDGGAGIIPAYAGSTRRRRARSAATPDHPRIRGEHISCSRFVPAIMGSSPHTRGAQRPGRFLSRPARIIPAYAGSTRARRRRCAAGRDHPRIRGEHLYMLASASERVGSSPHTRGAQIPEPLLQCGARIIPAYAGSTSRKDIDLAWRADHPRIRGEHHCAGQPGALDRGSSPHTRGALLTSLGAVASSRIIPAYAGSTGAL